jgi:hypothetical protein
MSKALIALVVIVVLAGGAYWYAQTQPAGMSDTASSTAMTEENGSVKPETTQVVGESMQGTWQSTDDAKSVREFKADGTFTDSYDGEVVGTGTYTVFTQAMLNGVTVSFPLDASAVYAQLSDSTAGPLNFRVTMSADANTLQMYYMDRGGVLNFARVQ